MTRTATEKKIAQQEENRWIPVSERLPEYNDKFLVYYGRGHKGIAFFSTKERIWYDNFPSTPIYWKPIILPEQAQVKGNDMVQKFVTVEDYEQLQAKNERLKEALESIQDWAKAYPLDIFPKPDLKEAQKVLKAAGMALDAISAADTDELDGIKGIVEQALKETQAQVKSGE